MTDQEIEQRRENLQSLIESELMAFTKETGRVIGNVWVHSSQYAEIDDYFYGVSLDDEL